LRTWQTENGVWRTSVRVVGDVEVGYTTAVASRLIEPEINARQKSRVVNVPVALVADEVDAAGGRTLTFEEAWPGGIGDDNVRRHMGPSGYRTVHVYCDAESHSGKVVRVHGLAASRDAGGKWSMVHNGAGEPRDAEQTLVGDSRLLREDGLNVVEVDHCEPISSPAEVTTGTLDFRCIVCGFQHVAGTNRVYVGQPEDWQLRTRYNLRCKICGLHVELRQEQADKLAASEVSIVKLSALAASL
jgi:hypothetical protein